MNVTQFILFCFSALSDGRLTEDELLALIKLLLSSDKD